MHRAVHISFQCTLYIIVSVNTGTQHMCTRKLHPSWSSVCVVSLPKLWQTEMSLYFKLELQVSFTPSHQHLSTLVSVIVAVSSSLLLLFHIPQQRMLKKTKYFQLKNQDSTIKTHWTPKKHQNDVHSLRHRCSNI